MTKNPCRAIDVKKHIGMNTDVWEVRHISTVARVKVLDHTRLAYSSANASPLSITATKTQTKVFSIQSAKSLCKRFCNRQKCLQSCIRPILLLSYNDFVQPLEFLQPNPNCNIFAQSKQGRRTRREIFAKRKPSPL